MRRGTTFACVLLGVLLLEAAWVLVVPAFRGADEHDHVYKAAAVARGDWSPDHAAAPGEWGEVVRVPRDLVVAAGPACASLPYTTPANCTPGRDVGDGLVEVTSSAARYQPAYYAVVGTAARPFHGTTAVYVMRAVTALGSALLLALAAAVLLGAGPWPFVGLLAATTPAVVYSASVAAPNGVELAAAALVWAAGARLAAGAPDREVRALLLAVTVGAVLLAVLRTLGPLWLALVVGVLAAAFGTTQVRALVARTDARVCAAVVGAALVAGVGWTLSAAPNSVPPPEAGGSGPGVWSILPQQPVLWLLQSIGAFPQRDEPAPVLVYAVVLAAWAALAGSALRHGRPALRRALLLVVALSVLVPGAATVATYDALGAAWQGRYSYPLAMGALLLAGCALARAGVPCPPPVAVLGAAGVAVAELASLLRVLETYGVTGPLTALTAYAGVVGVVVGLVVAGAAALAAPVGLGGARVAARRPLPELRPIN